jgi:two-component system, cell cycle sensor histidine kinase and response regulator CckA
MQIALSDFQDQLMRGLSHRMNNILSLFHGYLGLLMDDKKLDSVTKEGLSKIKDGAKAASDLMERTNALVRPTAAVWRDVNLSDLLRQMRPTFESYCGARVRIAIECADDLPLVWADASRVRMAMVELVRNACEAAKSEVMIRVSASTNRVQGELFENSATSPEHWLTIAISDDGAGIPAEQAERIYQPFYSTKKRQNAAGLGLTVAIGCAQQLSGSVRHRSHPGETTFELCLPSRIAQAQEVAEVA